jgi:hypothetical protein
MPKTNQGHQLCTRSSLEKTTRASPMTSCTLLRLWFSTLGAGTGGIRFSDSSSRVVRFGRHPEGDLVRHQLHCHTWAPLQHYFVLKGVIVRKIRIQSIDCQKPRLPHGGWLYLRVAQIAQTDSSEATSPKTMLRTSLVITNQ